MRTLYVLVIFGTIILLSSNLARSQANWVKSLSNPSIAGAIEPAVVYDSTHQLFRLWYISTYDYSVHYAISFDGTTWFSYPNGSVLAPGQSGSIDEGGILGLAVIYVRGTYYMYYTALGVIQGGTDTLRICAATSIDGSNWQKYGANPVISTGLKNSWESSAVAGEHLLYDGGIFKMVYTGTDSIRRGKTGFATSPDGLHWTKYANNPVLSGDSAKWDAGNVYPGGFFKKDSIYYMLYAGSGIIGAGTQIGLATSIDAHTWVKPYSHPVIPFGNPGQWDQGWVAGGTLLYLNGQFNYWYGGYGSFGWEIGYAISDVGPLSIRSSAPENPERTVLEQNYPNPFNPSTLIEFLMPVAGRATLKVFDLRGAEVATLVNATLPIGRHAYQWNAQGISSGVYFYRLETAGRSVSRKMMVLK